MIDGYSTVQLPKHFDLLDAEEFTKGAGIGSALFKIYLSDLISV